tara:strand:+ start:431 stop:625 length:195 start_codon:yes stop_codon:yes gene_type:complete
MSNRHLNQKRRLNIPDLQTRIQQENQILFLKCHSPKTEHKKIEEKYREHLKRINDELEEIFNGF